MYPRYSPASARLDVAVSEVATWRKLEAKHVARQKLKGDKEKIRRMVMTPQKNGVDAVQVFPKEIWQLILKGLKAPEDIENAFKTCTLFQDLLQVKRRNEVVFPAVLELLNPEFIKLDETRNIRGVCRAWKNGFDQVAKKLEEKDKKQNSCLAPILRPKDIANEIRFEGVLTMATSQRVLRIDLPAERDDHSEEVFKVMVEEFIHRITAHLKSGGRSFSYFLISAKVNQLKEAAGLSYDKIYLLLRKWLSLMSELTRLGLSLETESVDGAEMKKLRKVLKSNKRFPRLHSLEKLDLCLDIGLNKASTIFESFLKANPQIKFVSMDCCATSWNARMGFQRALQALPLKAFSATAGHCTTDELEELIDPDWKLESLNLDVNLTRRIELKSLFDAINSYPSLKNLELNLTGSLTHLRLKLKLPRFNKAGVLRLPNVTTLALHLPERYLWYNVDFIFPLLKLENLRITYVSGESSFWDSSDDEYPSEADYDSSDYDESGFHKVRKEDRRITEPLFDLNGGSDLYESTKVWEVFPFLKKVTIRRMDFYGNLTSETVYFKALVEVEAGKRKEGSDSDFCDELN